MVDTFPFVDEDIGVADDANGSACLVDDRRGTEAAIRQHLQRLANGGAAADRYRIGRHQVLGPKQFKGHRRTLVRNGNIHGLFLRCCVQPDQPNRGRDGSPWMVGADQKFSRLRE
jgi:hypothetical protein